MWVDPKLDYKSGRLSFDSGPNTKRQNEMYNRHTRGIPRKQLIKPKCTVKFVSQCR